MILAGCWEHWKRIDHSNLLPRSFSLCFQIEKPSGYRIEKWPENRVERSGMHELWGWKLRKASFASFGPKQLRGGPWCRCPASPLSQAAEVWTSEFRLKGSCTDRTGRGNGSESSITSREKSQSECCEIFPKVVFGLDSGVPVSGWQPYKGGFGSIFRIDLFLQQRNRDT